MLATVSVAALCYYLGDMVTSEATPLLLFVMAVMAAAWYGGLWGGLLATLLSAVLAHLLFIEPIGVAVPVAPADQIRTVFFVIVGFLISALCGDLHSARRELKARLEQLEKEARERREAAAAQVEAEKALHQIGRRLQAILDYSPVLILVKDLAGRYLLVNRRCEEVLRVRADELVGRTAEEAFEPAFAAQCTAHDRELLERGTPQEFEQRLPGDGGETVLSAIQFLMPDETGAPMASCCIATDVTASKRAEESLRESEERFRFLAETIPSIVWTAAPDGTITYANHRWLQYCALTAEENARNWPQLVLHPDDRERCLAQWSQALAAGSEYEIEVRNRRYDGVYRWFLTRAVPQRNAAGEVTRWFGVTTDIHDQKQMESELRYADRRKDEFLATLAHELRNPLAPIKNAVDVLRLAGPPGPDVEWAREVIDRQVDHLTRLIEDLLDLSRITRDKLELRKQRIELQQVIQGAVEASRPVIDQQGHELTVTLPPEPIHLDADDVRLVQVFMNLLTNAAKYTPPGGHLWITAERAGESGAVEVRVRDDGVGIAPEKLPRLFEMFYQVENAHEHSPGGLGLGLTLVRRLVELHGGRVTAASAGLDQGSEFTVYLPVVAAARVEPVPAPGPVEAPVPEAVAPQTAPAARRILVVDDNQDAAASLALLLRLSGDEVEVAHDGLEAVGMAARFLPAIVLLDIGMPNLNGYNAARRIREQPWGRRMALIALTGWGQEEDRRRTREAGFNAHLTKPVDHAELMALLAELAAAHYEADLPLSTSPTAARTQPSG